MRAMRVVMVAVCAGVMALPAMAGAAGRPPSAASKSAPAKSTAPAKSNAEGRPESAAPAPADPGRTKGAAKRAGKKAAKSNAAKGKK